MWARSGTYLGRPVPGAERELIEGITNELVPAMRKLPGVIEARVLWPRSSEDFEISKMFCQMFIYFSEEADLTRMLDCPERERIRVIRDRLLKLFEGNVEHINFEVG